MTKFEATHVVMTQSDNKRTNGVVHCYKFGTEVMWVKARANTIKVVSCDGTVQFVELKDLRVATK